MTFDDLFTEHQRRQDFLQAKKRVQEMLDNLPEETKTALKLRYGTLDFGEMIARKKEERGRRKGEAVE